MLNIFKYLLILLELSGFAMIGFALWRFKKALEKHKKTSNSDFLSECDEKITQKRSITILIAGITITLITIIIQGILAFLYV